MAEQIKTIKKLHTALEARDDQKILQLVEALHYADLGDVYEKLSPEERDYFGNLIGPETFAGFIAELPDTLVEQSLDHFDDDEKREILDSVSDDDRVDILQDVSEETREELLDLIEDEDIDVTRSLLKYGEETAGGRMTTSYGSVVSNLTVKQALESLRGSESEVETMARIYVVDEKDKLVGMLRFRDLAFNPWDKPISAFVRPNDHYVLASADQEEAAKMFSKYDLIALPVVDEQHRLVGIITHDDAVEIIQEETREDMEKMAGFSGLADEETYLNTSVISHFKRRFPWLVSLAFLGILSGFVMFQFEDVLSSLFLLAIFLPMVVAAGGNSGGQASTMVIRAMALGEMNEASATVKVAWKEVRLGLLLGLIIGALMAVFITFILPHFHSVSDSMPTDISFARFALAIALSITAQVTTSTLVGSMLPICADRMKIDPAVVAAPAITTIVDVTGMVIYFLVARVILL